MVETTQSRALMRSFISFAILLVGIVVVLFGPAGTLDWPQAWYFIALFVISTFIAIAVIWQVNPELLAARARVQAGTKSWDCVFIVLIVGAIAAILPVAALDFRFGWSKLPDWTVALGYGLFLSGFAVQTWAQAVNRYFEPGVRIQEDRGQTVVDRGPYAIVRHPGYISAASFSVGIALALASGSALIPVVVVVTTLVLRTLLEEQTLRTELPGYADYSRRVRYRWLPGIW